MRHPKQNTTQRIFFDLMEKAVNDNSEICIENLTNRHGELVPRTTISMYTSSLAKKYFNGSEFYTRTKKSDGLLYLGCFPPKTQPETNTDPDAMAEYFRNL